MGVTLLSTFGIENHHHPSTLLSIDRTSVLQHPIMGDSSNNLCDSELVIQPRHQSLLFGAPDINMPLSVDPSPPPQSWNFDHFEMVDVCPGPQMNEPHSALTLPKAAANGTTVSRKFAKRGDSIWGAWFFFNYYFKPVISDKSAAKVQRHANGIIDVKKSDLNTDVFLVQHDMENMYMWVFKDRAENALGKMQLRSFMNGHSRHGEPRFPFCADKGFVRSHKMQRKYYRGLSNPQCIHGIDVVRSPNLSLVPEVDRERWTKLTGRDLDFTIPLEASDFRLWRNLPTTTDFELDKAPGPLKSIVQANTSLNLSAQTLNHAVADSIYFSSKCGKRRKKLFPHVMEENSCSSTNSYFDRTNDVEMHAVEPTWLNEFSGVMKHCSGPVTAAKTIYEDEEGYLIMVSLPFSDKQRVKVSWKNTVSHGVVKISCVSTGQMPLLKRHNRTFKLTDTSPEHCPPGEFVREITLAERIPEDAKIEAYYDESGAILEMMVPKRSAEPEEHEVRVRMWPWSQ